MHGAVLAVRATGRALRRQPEALFLALLCLLSGLVHFLGTPLPNPVEALIHPLMVVVWYAQLTVGAALRGAGLLVESPKLSLAGSLLLSTASLVYASAIVYVDGPGSVVAASVTYAFFVTYLLVAAAYMGDLIRSRGRGPVL